MTMLVDYAAFRELLPGTGPQLLAQELISSTDNGATVDGIQKLFQEVLLRLITIKGTVAYDASYGCSFMEDAQIGAWRTVADVMQSFAIAKVDVAQQVQAAQLATDTNEEIYKSLELIQVVLAGMTVTITLQLTNQAGTIYTASTPLTVKNL